MAVANLAEVERLAGHVEEAARLGRDAIAELEDVGDPGHRRRVLATVGLALAEVGETEEAEVVLTELHPPGSTLSMDGPAAVVAATLALRRGEADRAAELFTAAIEAYEGGHDPRDTMEALLGLIRSSRDADGRQKAVHRLTEMCRTAGISLLPRDRRLIGEPPR